MKIQLKVISILSFYILTGCDSKPILFFDSIFYRNTKLGDASDGYPTPLATCNGTETNPNVFPESATPPTNIISVYNACDQEMWLATDAGAFGTPSRANPQMIASHMYFDIPNTTIASGRLWAKYGCDGSGQNCTVGQEVDPCPSEGCQPPFNSGFEIDNSSGTTYYDITMVNGFTGPVKVYAFNGAPENSDCNGVSTPENLSIQTICPSAAMLNTPRSGWDQKALALNPNIIFGDFNDPYYNSFGQTIHLDQPHSLIARSPITQEIIGCFSPGQKLSSVPAWGGLGVAVCTGSQCKSNTPPDINSIGGSAQAYDSRVVMYQNPYNACDLTDGTVGDNNNCLNGTKIPVQLSHGPLAYPNGFEYYLVNYCTFESHAITSPYCSDKIASQGNPAIQLKGSTAASNMGHLGPILKTKYVNYVHQCIPNTYAWQYDDANALKKCPNTSSAGTFKMVVAFGCPVK